MKVSTFTRCCWLLEGAYFLLASCSHFYPYPVLSRITEIIFGVVTASAILVTTVTYGVLVPGAMFLSVPKHLAGDLQDMYSWESHSMHIANSVFMLIEAKLSKREMKAKDSVYGMIWGVTWVIHEWIFYQYTRMWHYPFMDYNAPLAPVVYTALLAALMMYWYLGCRVTAKFAAPEVASSSGSFITNSDARSNQNQQKGKLT